jgi:hypothetical protein
MGRVNERERTRVDEREEGGGERCDDLSSNSTKSRKRGADHSHKQN